MSRSLKRFSPLSAEEGSRAKMLFFFLNSYIFLRRNVVPSVPSYLELQIILHDNARGIPPPPSIFLENSKLRGSRIVRVYNRRAVRVTDSSVIFRRTLFAALKYFIRPRITFIPPSFFSLFLEKFHIVRIRSGNFVGNSAYCRYRCTAINIAAQYMYINHSENSISNLEIASLGFIGAVGEIVVKRIGDKYRCSGIS